MRVEAYLLMEDVKDECDAQVYPGMSASPFEATWKYVVHVLFARFVQDDVLHAAHHSVSRAAQSVKEDEMQMLSACCMPRERRNVFWPAELLNVYLRALPEGSR